jgi:parallel beta-helix repeat protein
MKKRVCSALILRLCAFILCINFAFLSAAHATNYYVRIDGNDNNNGLTNTPGGAWRTINTVLYGYANYGAGPGGSGIPMRPGDTLFVNDGVYVEDGYGYGLKMDNLAGTNTNRFVMKSINKWGAKLQLSSSDNSFNIRNTKGFTIDGFEMYNAPSDVNTHLGIFVANNSEFVTIRNCKLHNFGLGAIGGGGHNFIIEYNEVYNNARRNPNNGSGISIYHPKKVSNATLAGGYGCIIRGNYAHDNYCALFYTDGRTPSDGNGIIIDDWNFTQGNPSDPTDIPYTLPCLIENNLCVYNGGSGIRVYDSNNVTIRNNTCYYNSWVTSTYPSGTNVYPSGDIGVSSEATKGDNIVIVNNISITDPALPVANKGIAVGTAVTNVVITNNYTNSLFFAAGATPTPNIIGNSPQFVNANITTTNNFRLQNGSPAINIGTNSNAASVDYDGKARPNGANVDAGCFEYLAPLPVEWLSFTLQTAAEPMRVRLAWATASEHNAKCFEIERSNDGTAFERIATVAANGSTSTVSKYTFDDIQPYFGTSYYRLKQVDYDGEFSYSNTQMARLRPPHEPFILPTNVFYRGQDMTIITQTADLTATFTDIKGRIWLAKKLDNGTNTIGQNEMSAGVYFVHIANNETFFIKKIVIQ